eukprot:gene22922-29100_t
MKEIDTRRLQHVKKLQSINRVQVFAAILSDQRWINGLFVDSVDSHLKLVVRKFLTLPAGGTSLRPDQTTINEAFVRCVTKGNLSMAIMLSQGRMIEVEGESVLMRGVDQQGFDEALKAVSEADCEEGLEWLLRGTQGLTPSCEVVDEIYLERSRRPPIATYPVGRGFGRNQYSAWMNSNAKRKALIDSIDSLFTARASEEAVATITRERRIAAARQAHFNQMRHRAEPEIHSYSGVRIDQANGAQFNDGEGDFDGDEEGGMQPPMDVDRGPGGGGGGADEGDGEDDDRPDRGAPPVPVAARRPITLNAAVMDYIDRRVGGVAFTLEQITARMTALIAETFPTVERQTEAMQIVAQGMNAQNERILGLTLNFLSDERFPPSAMNVWIQGFLVESIVVHSCNPGAMERIVTGLRGVDDPELNRIFTQAEGPNLARIFLMGTFNIYFSENDQASRASARRNAMNLAREIVSRGINAESTDVQAGEALTAYALERMTGYGVRDSFANEVRRTVETVTDMYEEFLQPFVREVLVELETARAAAGVTEMQVVPPSSSCGAERRMEEGENGGGAGGESEGQSEV